MTIAGQIRIFGISKRILALLTIQVARFEAKTTI
jgi:hypothetical protein